MANITLAIESGGWVEGDGGKGKKKEDKGRMEGEGGKGRDGRSMRGKVGGLRGRNQEGETVIAD